MEEAGDPYPNLLDFADPLDAQWHLVHPYCFPESLLQIPESIIPVKSCGGRFLCGQEPM